MTTSITLEEYEIMKDSKYRMYVAAIDKALKNFEYTSEWADLISALGKLNKVLQSHAKFPVIPRRIKISKRLAQCMHPALPSGVHLKALETYDIIFRCMGTNRLACELFIYSSGLFPLMSHAAMNIRPTLLTIFETHFVPLGEKLRPALSGFLSGILPGLDNGSDHFERTNTLFENVCESVSPAYFYTCIWQCVANNSPVRLPAITYVLAHYNRKLHMEDQLYLMGHDVGLMVCGLCAAVQDSSVLVQRSALDLLILCFPMQNKQLIYSDMVRLVTAALTTILRRDMSLNRRLYSWLLETDSTAAAALANYDELPIDNNNSLIGSHHLSSSGGNHQQQSIAYDLLNDAIRDILKKSCSTIPLDMKPYRLLTSLFEKPQIGPIILDGILYDVFRVLFLSCLNLQKHKNQSMRCVSFNGDLNSLKSDDEKWLSKQFVSKNCQELVKNANLLFNTLQSYYIWSYIEKLYEDAVKTIKKFKYRDRYQVNDVGSGVPYILELCLLTDFLLDVIPTESYAETTSNILPSLFNKIINTLNNYITDLNHLEISKSLELATRILGKIQPITMTQAQQEIEQEKLQQQHQDKSMITEEQRTIEKSKSDSRINENLNIEQNELIVEEPLSLRERSYSNQFLKKKEKSSPKIEKKSTKNKKSKSSSKLYDLKTDQQENDIKDHHPPSSSLNMEDSKEKQLSPPVVAVMLSSPPPQSTTTQQQQHHHQIVPCSSENKHFIKCLEQYQGFFVCFIEKKILPDIDINQFFTNLIYDREERMKQLRQLLINDTSNCSFPTSSIPLKKEMLICLNIASENAESECEHAMNVASNLLLEFCAFPILSNSSINAASTSISHSIDSLMVPKWLIALLVSACCKMSSREVQLIAMNTLLEIFSLAKNQDFIKKCQNEKNIIIIGILEIQYIVYIEKNTRAIEEMTRILWSLLGLVKNQKQLMQCVTLLYQIHNIFDTNLFVEQIIGNFLSDQNITTVYLKQFFTLWHFGRDLNIKRLPPNDASTRNFNRCLLKILDMLSNKTKPTMQLLSESFLNHCLLHNDITRVLYPILFKLLASNTATVSIRHVNIQDGEVQDGERSLVNANSELILEETRAKKVYAVSSVNGNIMYHVTDENKPKSPKKRWFGFSSGKSGKKYASAINMTTSLMEDSNNIVTAKNKDFKGYTGAGSSPKAAQTTKNNMKVIINPLSSKEIYSDGLEGSYARLDSHSSTESLSSTENTISNDDSIEKKFGVLNGERDSGYDTINPNNNLRKQNEILNVLVDNSKKALLESMESISDGIKAVKLSKSHSFDEKTHDIHRDAIIENTLVQSWSYCISDSANLNNNCELEFSRSAEEFFNIEKNEVKEMIGDILNKIIDDVCDKVCPIIAQQRTKRPTDLDLKYKTKKNFVLYPIHAHLCLYCENFDSNQVIYALTTLRGCIQCNPKLFIKCSATSGVKNLKSNEILHLLARHRKSYLGLSFNGELSQEHVNFYRGYTFLDVIITICLTYCRAFFPFFHDGLTSSSSTTSSSTTPILLIELENNIKIHLESFEILNLIIENLIAMVEETNHSNKGGGSFISYIADLLIKCKIQKILLPCLLMSVRNFDEEMTFAEDVLSFNNFRLIDHENHIGEHVESFQIQLLRLIHSLIILEYSVFPTTTTATTSTTVTTATSTSAATNQPGTQASGSDPLIVESSATSANNERLNYKPSILIPHQNMFLSAILSALRNKNMKNLHEKWLNMVTCCLPYFGENLKQISLSVIHQICNNIEAISVNYKKLELEEFEELGSDYTVTQLESLTILCHYCLLDPSQTVNQQVPASTASLASSSSITAPTEILNNLVNVFFTPMSSDLNSSTKQNSDYYQEARKTILSHMPRIISSVAKLWQTVVGIESDYTSIYGNSKMVKQQLLEFLSPIAVHHGASFLAAVAVAWYERRNPLANFKTVLPEPNTGQNNLVYLVSAIRVIPLDNLVQTVTAVIKNPPPCDGLNSDVCLEVSILELFYCYMRNASATQLSEAWTSLLALVREVTSLNPSAQFLVAAVLHEMMIKCCPLEEKKDQKDLQDITAKLIDSISQVCASCLEQTTWLRKSFAVREQDKEATIDTSASSNVISGGSPDLVFSSSHSVQAQLVLAEILAPILDICFGSSEKDKVNNILASLMCSIVPYLKTHTIRNMPSFVACSKLLSSLSSYQYTRKAWKKEVFDLLLDNSLFQMDHLCLKYWRIIVDNLMTHDNTTFRDLMARVSMTQSGTLGIFSSREQEYEQKAQLLKRLAYVIFCSEIDQYAKYMPEIQEQLTTNLRLNVPGIQAQVFLCFRVILIRMSPLHVTSLWPIIISEMLQVFIQIEQELTTDTEEFRLNNSSHIKLMSSLDASWATNSSNGLHALGHPHWLRLQLAAAKLLDLMLLLPATTLPQFQMYRWAFVGDDPVSHYSNNDNYYSNQASSSSSSFTPHVIRIAELMDRRYIDSRIDILPMKRNELLLTTNQLKQLKDLHSFFKTLSSCSDRHRTECSKSYNSNDNFFTDRHFDKQLDIILNKIDKVVEADFLDKIPR